MAFLDIPIYAVSTMIPVMLIAIGVADGIHIFSHMQLYKRNYPGSDIINILKNMYREMWRPVVMTSVTTAVGFISLISSEVYPVKYFGLFTAFGVIAAMFFSLVMIPAGTILLGFPKPKKEKYSNENRLLYRVSMAIISNKYKILLITALIIIISAMGINRVWIDSSFLGNFEEDSEIVRTDKFINKNFGGTSTLNIILEGKEKNSFKNPDILKIVDSIQTDAEKLTLVGNSFSLANYIKRMNKVIHEDRKEFDTIPDSTDAIAQYLLLYEMSGNPDNLWKSVNYGYNKMNLVIQLKDDGSKAIKETISLIKNYEKKLSDRNISINYAGSGYKSLIFTNLILEGQIKSLIISFGIVIILIAFIFKSFFIGLIGAIPIIITAVINFGVMGLLNIPLSSTTALLSSIAVGIGIDYSIHFIERYKQFAGETNDKNETVKMTMHHSGRAIIFNAFVVISGFLVLLLSLFPPNRALGALVSLNMFTCFLGTVTVMLILLYKSNIYFRKFLG